MGDLTGQIEVYSGKTRHTDSQLYVCTNLVLESSVDISALLLLFFFFGGIKHQGS